MDEYKTIIHREVFVLVYKGGSFTHSDVYNMPSPYRRVYIKLLEEALEKEKKAIDESMSKNKQPSMPHR